MSQSMPHAIRQDRLFIPGPVGRLQALHEPGEPGRPAVVICHPHPLFGGTMRNKVVYWMARAFGDAGCATLRFNFRGVEQSDGAWDEGRGETRDAAAALDWMAGRHAGAPLWLAGFSFGCYAGLAAAREDARVARMFAVAPAVNHWDFSFMCGETRPVVVIAGTKDEIVPFQAVRAAVRAIEADGNVRFHAIEGAGHFFPEHQAELQRILREEIAAGLSPRSDGAD